MSSNSFYLTRVRGAQIFSNIFWASILFGGSLAFLLTGILSYMGQGFLFGINQLDTLSFIPQGLVMCFYGTAGVFLGTYLTCIILFNIGAGYNEIDCNEGVVIIFRWGFPGRNRKLRVRCLIRDIKKIILSSQNSFTNNASINLELQSGIRVPLYSSIQNWSIKKTEEEAARLAQYLEVPLETIE